MISDPQPSSGWVGRHYFPDITAFKGGRAQSGRRACDKTSVSWTQDWKQIYREGHAVVATPPQPGAPSDRGGACWMCLIEAPIETLGCNGEERQLWLIPTICSILKGMQDDVRAKNVSQRQLAVWIDRGVDRCIELVEGDWT